MQMKKSTWSLKYVTNGIESNLDMKFDLYYGKNTIGRGRGNTIVLRNDTVSRNHCRLWIHPQGIPVINDLGSKNGTAVQERNLEGIDDYFLNTNDYICLSSREKGVLFQICVSDQTLNVSDTRIEKQLTVKKEDFSVEEIELGHETLRSSINHLKNIHSKVNEHPSNCTLDTKSHEGTNYQENDIQTFTSNNDDTINCSNLHITEKQNKSVQDENYLAQREYYSTQWAIWCQKQINSDSSSDTS